MPYGACTSLATFGSKNCLRKFFLPALRSEMKMADAAFISLTTFGSKLEI